MDSAELMTNYCWQSVQIFKIFHASVITHLLILKEIPIIHLFHTKIITQRILCDM